MSQAAQMMAGEGDAWLARNRSKLGLIDPVSVVIDENRIQPTSVFEVGCSNGWRLAKLRDKYGCSVRGIDASQQAVDEAEKNGLLGVSWCAADRLPFPSKTFDLVIYGFCLYVVDRADLFAVVSEGDRVLRDGGHIIIHDFYEPGLSAYRVPYAHREGLWSYHMNHHDLWLANPAYKRIAHFVCGRGEAAVVLKKHVSGGWPELK